jgi:hypothetical protein
MRQEQQRDKAEQVRVSESTEGRRKSSWRHDMASRSFGDLKPQLLAEFPPFELNSSRSKQSRKFFYLEVLDPKHI